MKDILGEALLDYYQGNYTEDIITWTSISNKDLLPLPYLFRDFEAMPSTEQTALKLSKDHILDVGCGAGNHSLWLQKQGYYVKAIDISKGAIAVCKARGIVNTEVKNLLQETETFDTILLLMNGTGIFKTLAEASTYLNHLKSLLKTNGQILIDSSDIQYMYEDNMENMLTGEAQRYYGEIDYYYSYKAEVAIPTTWLYLDFKTLKHLCRQANLYCNCIKKGTHYDYLARITKEPQVK